MVSLTIRQDRLRRCDEISVRHFADHYKIPQKDDGTRFEAAPATASTYSATVSVGVFIGAGTRNEPVASIDA